MPINNLTRSNKKKKQKQFPWIWVLVIFGILWLLTNLRISPSGIPIEIAYGDFYRILKEEPSRIKSATKMDTLIEGRFSDEQRFFLHIPGEDPELLSLLREKVSLFDVKPPRTLWAN